MSNGGEARRYDVNLLHSQAPLGETFIISRKALDFIANNIYGGWEDLSGALNNLQSTSVNRLATIVSGVDREYKPYTNTEFYELFGNYLPRMFYQRAQDLGYVLDGVDLGYAVALFADLFVNDARRSRLSSTPVPWTAEEDAYSDAEKKEGKERRDALREGSDWVDFKPEGAVSVPSIATRQLFGVDPRGTPGAPFGSIPVPALAEADRIVGERYSEVEKVIMDLARDLSVDREIFFDQAPNYFTEARQFEAIFTGIAKSKYQGETFLPKKILDEIQREGGPKDVWVPSLNRTVEAADIVGFMEGIKAMVPNLSMQIFGASQSDDLEEDMRVFGDYLLKTKAADPTFDMHGLQTFKQYLQITPIAPAGGPLEAQRDWARAIESDPTGEAALDWAFSQVRDQDGNKIYSDPTSYTGGVERTTFQTEKAKAKEELKAFIAAGGRTFREVQNEAERLVLNISTGVWNAQQSELSDLYEEDRAAIAKEYKGTNAEKIMQIAASQGIQLSESAANTILITLIGHANQGGPLPPLDQAISYWAHATSRPQPTPYGEGDSPEALRFFEDQTSLVAESREEYLRAQRGQIYEELTSDRNIRRILRGMPALVRGSKIWVNKTPLIGPDSSDEYVADLTAKIRDFLDEASLADPDEFLKSTLRFLRDSLQSPGVSRFLGMGPEAGEALWKTELDAEGEALTAEDAAKARRTSIARGETPGIQARLGQLGIIGPDTPIDEIGFAVAEVQRRLPWDRFEDPSMTETEKLQQVEDVISGLFPGEYARTARTDYDRGGPSLPGQFGQEPTFPAEGWRGPAERQEEDARLTALSQQEELARMYSQQKSPLGPGSYRDPFTNEGIAGPAAIPEAPGMDLRKGRFAGDIFRGEFDPVLTGVEAEREQTEFVRAARALAEEEAARLEDDPARQSRLASQLLQDLIDREEAFMPQYQSELTKRFETSQKNLLASFRTGELHKALQGLSREEAVDYSRQLFGMEQQDATRRVREDFSLGKFLRTKLPNISEQRGLLNFEAQERTEAELFQQGLAQAQRSARIAEAMREDPIFRAPRGRGRTVVL